MSHSMLQASLPMYDFPEIRETTKAWWQGIAKHMKHQGINNIPVDLTHDVPVKELWLAENLFLSQCCGFDVMNSYKDHLSVLMISDWNVEGCDTGQYSSFIVVHEDSLYRNIAELKDSTAVINGPESHSGMNALFSTIQPHSLDGQFFKTIYISGAHADSLRFIQSQQADVAAIDCVTFALLKQYRPAALHGIRVLCQSKSAPALPYVTSINTSIATQLAMQAALQDAFNDPDLAQLREKLLLKGAIFPDLSEGQGAYSGANNPYRGIADGFSFDQRLLEPIVISEVF